MNTANDTLYCFINLANLPDQFATIHTGQLDIHDKYSLELVNVRKRFFRRGKNFTHPEMLTLIDPPGKGFLVFLTVLNYGNFRFDSGKLYG